MNLKDQQVGTSVRLARFAAAVSMCLCTSAYADVIYNSIPTPHAPNVPSLGYEANQVNEFGGLIHFDGGARNLTSVSVLMSSWALKSTYPTVGLSSGFSVPLTLSLYNIGPSDTVGTQIATQTLTTVAPWRPEADSTCDGGTAWRSSDGKCYNGLAFEVTFGFTGVVVPDNLIFGLGFNTQTAGYSPTGSPAPQNSLNFGLSTVAPSVGSTALDGTAYGSYGDTLGMTLDTGWRPYIAAARFDAVPEPTSIALLGLGLAAVGLSRRKRPT